MAPSFQVGYAKVFLLHRNYGRSSNKDCHVQYKPAHTSAMKTVSCEAQSRKQNPRSSTASHWLLYSRSQHTIGRSTGYHFSSCLSVRLCLRATRPSRHFFLGQCALHGESRRVSLPCGTPPPLIGCSSSAFSLHGAAARPWARRSRRRARVGAAHPRRKTGGVRAATSARRRLGRHLGGGTVP